MLDLFSGIGGFSLAGSWLGFETVAFCEIDLFAQMVLRKHWPNVKIEPDIRTLDGHDYAGIDLITGGFPCQPYSIAGQRAGEHDDRALWPEMARVIYECRPRWILIEQVVGFISLALDDCLSELESHHYEAWAVVIPAASVGAWHRRKRVWVVGHTDEPRSQRHDRSRPDSGQLPAESAGLDAAAVAPGQFSHGVGRTRHGCAESANGDGRLAESGLCRVADGLPAWVHRDLKLADITHPDPLANNISSRVNRLHALGNAIVPAVAYEIMAYMVEVDNDESYG